jgi:hypothetical protein
LCSLSNYIWRRIEITKFVIMQLFRISGHLIFFSVQTFYSASCSQTPSVYVPPLMSETKFHIHTEPEAKLWCVYSNFYLDGVT